MELVIITILTMIILIIILIMIIIMMVITPELVVLHTKAERSYLTVKCSQSPSCAPASNEKGGSPIV